MFKPKFILILSFLFFIEKGLSNIKPKNSSILNYTHILFEFPLVNNADYYEIQLFDSDTDNPFPKCIYRDSTNVFFIDNFEFGKSYTWSYIAYSKNSIKKFSSEKYTFSITSKRSNPFKSEFLTTAIGPSKGYLSIDYTKNIVSRTGKEVWRLPNFSLENILVRDLRITPKGTFTCIIVDKMIVEFDIDGNILWKGPDNGQAFGDTIEKYHHEFRFTKNKHYLTLGESYQLTEMKNVTNKENLKFTKNIIFKNNKIYNSAIFGTVIEYNSVGDIIWKWNSADFFNTLIAYGWSNGATHLNAIYQDDDEKNIYLSFKELHLILKIDKKTKQVVSSYGQKLSTNHFPSLQNKFSFQHGIEKTKEGNLIVFNNDSVELDYKTSSVIVIDEGGNDKSPKIKSIYSCKLDNQSDGKALKYGCAEELDNGNILGIIGIGNRFVEFDTKTEGQINWKMDIMTYNEQWTSESTYRAHYISDLYPCYYSIRKEENGISIYNEGTNEDSYNIIQKSTRKKIAEINNIKSNQRKYINLPVDEIYKIVIQSKTNEDLIKQF